MTMASVACFIVCQLKHDKEWVVRSHKSNIVKVTFAWANIMGLHSMILRLALPLNCTCPGQADRQPGYSLLAATLTSDGQPTQSAQCGSPSSLKLLFCHLLWRCQDDDPAAPIPRLRRLAIKDPEHFSLSVRCEVRAVISRMCDSHEKSRYCLSD